MFQYLFNGLLLLYVLCVSNYKRGLVRSQDDCLVKVWYSTSKWQSDATKLFTPTDLSSQEKPDFSFIYLAHPRSVTGFSWRKTSKYMPRWGDQGLQISEKDGMNEMINFNLRNLTNMQTSCKSFSF